jgi:hypothetical protein
LKDGYGKACLICLETVWRESSWLTECITTPT